MTTHHERNVTVKKETTALSKEEFVQQYMLRRAATARGNLVATQVARSALKAWEMANE